MCGSCDFRVCCGIVCPHWFTDLIKRKHLAYTSKVNNIKLEYLQHELTIQNLRHQNELREYELQPLIDCNGDINPILKSHTNVIKRIVNAIVWDSTEITDLIAKHYVKRYIVLDAFMHKCSHRLKHLTDNLDKYIQQVKRYHIAYSRGIPLIRAENWSVTAATQVAQNVGAVMQIEGIKRSSNLAYKMEKNAMELANRKTLWQNKMYGKLQTFDQNYQTRQEIRRSIRESRKDEHDREGEAVVVTTNNTKEEEDNIAKQEAVTNDNTNTNTNVLFENDKNNDKMVVLIQPTSTTSSIVDQIEEYINVSHMLIKNNYILERINKDCQLHVVLECIRSVINIRDNTKDIIILDKMCLTHYTVINNVLTTLYNIIQNTITFELSTMPQMTKRGLNIPNTET